MNRRNRVQRDIQLRPVAGRQANGRGSGLVRGSVVVGDRIGHIQRVCRAGRASRAVRSRVQGEPWLRFDCEEIGAGGQIPQFECAGIVGIGGRRPHQVLPLPAVPRLQGEQNLRIFDRFAGIVGHYAMNHGSGRQAKGKVLGVLAWAGHNG